LKREFFVSVLIFRAVSSGRDTLNLETFTVEVLSNFLGSLVNILQSSEYFIRIRHFSFETFTIGFMLILRVNFVKLFIVLKQL